MTLELHGVSRVGDKYEFSFYNVRTKSSYWVGLNDASNPDIQVVSFDPVSITADVQANGREMQLSLKAPSTQPMAVPPETPPLVVYSPYDTGGNRAARGPANGAVPAPIAAPAGQGFGGGQFVRGAGQFGGNGGNGGNGGGRGGYGNGNGNGNGGGGYGNGNGGGGNGGGGYGNGGGGNGGGGGFGNGGGGAVPRRQIVQPGG
jgi:hypothetical protein